eukprot:CAMPEP_0184380326 /NCGR_PEP_ID=MMETSP0007-20130409/4643_1 /TAXON_ID=97485 /ORGANISM="Prymnesium parvum, Strain Texoma1" /LENGTH=109 /DNA_ID=CAMNT_0026725501 /DNA_START=275 /DNA_END=604 /DNA_ORIENTATION=-
MAQRAFLSLVAATHATIERTETFVRREERACALRHEPHGLPRPSFIVPSASLKEDRCDAARRAHPPGEPSSPARRPIVFVELVGAHGQQRAPVSSSCAYARAASPRKLH